MKPVQASAKHCPKSLTKLIAWHGQAPKPKRMPKSKAHGISSFVVSTCLPARMDQLLRFGAWL